MTGEEAIRCLSVHSSTNGSGLCTDEQHYEAKQMAIEAIEQTTWIPVSERLPEDYDRYLITTKDGRVETIYYGYTDDRPNEIAFHQWDDDGWQCWKPDVTAWMPLPEPYKEARKRAAND